MALATWALSSLLPLLEGVGRFGGGRRIGRFFLFHALFRALGPVWGTVVIVAVLLALAMAARSIAGRRR